MEQPAVQHKMLPAKFPTGYLFSCQSGEMLCSILRGGGQRDLIVASSKPVFGDQMVKTCSVLCKALLPICSINPRAAIMNYSKCMKSYVECNITMSYTAGMITL